MKWVSILVAALLLVSVAVAEGEIWEEDDHEVLIRSERGAKNRGEVTCCGGGVGKPKQGCDSGEVCALDEGGSEICDSGRSADGRVGVAGCCDPCRYLKGAWSECDPKTNMRTRTLTLKKGDQAACEQTKTIQKKCKKACRYEKGTWSECSPQNQMSRSDTLKANSDPSCEQSRQITKKCKSKGAKAAKGGRRNRQ